MKSTIGILILCLFCQICLGQILTRKTLHGQVLNDSIKIENGVVFNINSKTGTVINNKGFFSLLAKENDTLVFSSLVFKSKKIALTKNDFSIPLLRIKLDAYTNELLEVVVVAKKGINPLGGDSQAIVDKQFFDDEKSSPINRTMPPDGSIENGLDFVRIYKDIFKIIIKNNPQKKDFISSKGFTEVAINSVSYDFFTYTLNLDKDEIGLFLIFCENDTKAKDLLNPKDKFQLIDFMIAKNKEYKNITTVDK